MINCKNIKSYEQAESLLNTLWQKAATMEINDKFYLFCKEIKSAEKYLKNKGVYWVEEEDIYA